MFIQQALNSDTMSEEDSVNLDYEWLTIDKINFKMGESSSEVISDFTVPIKGKYGSLLTWSINPLSIAQINHANGEFKITRPQYGDATADLSINISKKGFAKTKSLAIRIVGISNSTTTTSTTTTTTTIGIYGDLTGRALMNGAESNNGGIYEVTGKVNNNASKNFEVVDPALSTTHGEYTIDANGNWAYTLIGRNLDSLNVGDHTTDSFIVKTSDSFYSATVTITIWGATLQEELEMGYYIQGAGSGGGGSGGINANGGNGGAGGKNDGLVEGSVNSDIIFGDGFDGLVYNGANGGFGGFGGFGGGGGGGGGGVNDIGGRGGLGAGNGGGSSNSNYIPTGWDNNFVSVDSSLFVGSFGNTGESGNGGDSMEATYGSTTSTTIGKGGVTNTTTPPYSFAGGGAFGGASGGNGLEGNGIGKDGTNGHGNTIYISDMTGNGAVYNFVKDHLEYILLSYTSYGNGNDTINGGPGSDHLFGLGGNDAFVFELTDAVSGNDIDTIWDFCKNGDNDKIKLTIGGTSITNQAKSELISKQKTSGDTDKDREIVFTDGGQYQVTIIFKDIGRDIELTDFID